MDDLQRGYEALEALKRVLREHDYPGTNPKALAAVTQAVNRLRNSNPYVSETAGKILILANDFYSATKHQRHPGGADRVYADMLNELCRRIEDQFETLRINRAL